VSEPTAPSLLEVQVDALLERVNQHRERRASEIRARTAKESSDIVRGARAEARKNLHEAVGRERARIAQGLRQAEARAELESRWRAQRETHTLLRHMWEGIAAALEARWDAKAERRAWISAAIEEATVLLGGREWCIDYGGDVSPEERERGERFARSRGARDVQWRPEPQLRAGLRIRAPGACLDATIEGLLVQRADVEAAFLSEYQTVGAPDREQPMPPSGASHPPPLAQDRTP